MDSYVHGYMHSQSSLQHKELVPDPPNYWTCKSVESRVKFTLEWLIKHYGTMSEPNFRRKKNLIIAETLIKRGTIQMNMGRLMSAHWRFNGAIVYATPDSEMQMEAYASRALLWHKSKKYHSCIADINRMLLQNYPDHLKAMLYFLKTKTLFKIHGKLSPPVQESIDNVNKWIDKATNDQRKKIIKGLEELTFTTCEYDDEDEIFDNTELMKKITDDNATIVGASSAIEIKYTEKIGFHFIATRTIEAGEAIVVDQAYTSIPGENPNDSPEEDVYEYCWHCSKITTSAVSCHQCVNVIYCDENCRDAAWREHHDIECPIITIMMAADMKHKQLMALRLTIKAYKEAGSSIDALIVKVEKLNDIGDLFLMRNGEIYDCTRYASVYTIIKDYTKEYSSFESTIDSMRILMLLAKYTKIFGKKIIQIQDLMSHHTTIFMGEFILKNMIISHKYGVALQMATRTDGTEIKMRHFTIFPINYLFKHNYNPNVYPIMQGDKRSVITIQQIKEGESIIISNQSRPFEFNFTRNIFRGIYHCISPFILNPTTLCMKEDSLSMAIQNKLNDAQEKYNKWVKENRLMRENEVAEAIQSLLEIANIYGECIKYPTNELDAVKRKLIEYFTFVSR